MKDVDGLLNACLPGGNKRIGSVNRGKNSVVERKNVCETKLDEKRKRRTKRERKGRREKGGKGMVLPGTLLISLPLAEFKVHDNPLLA
jgi:hypothetical protein